MMYCFDVPVTCVLGIVVEKFVEKIVSIFIFHSAELYDVVITIC